MVGPTAIGKTAVAVELCRRTGGEIVSFDSRQVYQGLEICSNAPTAGDLRGVRCHLVGVIPVGRKIDAAGYVAMARPIVEDMLAANRQPFLTAGTGLYLKTLLEGLDLGGHPADPELRKRLEKEAKENLPALHARLTKLNPAGARRVEATNPTRVVRAVELALRRKRGDAPTTQVASPMAAIKVGLSAPRTKLYEWIDARLDRMLDGAWIAEVQALLDSGADISGNALSSIGLQELTEVAGGRQTLEIGRAAIAKRTRNYAKRQLTWFRADPGVRWLDVTSFAGSDIVDAILDLVDKQ